MPVSGQYPWSSTSRSGYGLPFSVVRPAAIYGPRETRFLKLAKALKVIGLLNIQFAIKGRTIYVLEVNPRASRTVPFVSKATGVPVDAEAVNSIDGAVSTVFGGGDDEEAWVGSLEDGERLLAVSDAT